MKGYIPLIEKNRNSVPLIIFLLSIDVLLLYLLYRVRNMSGVNRYFISFHALSMLVVSSFLIYFSISEAREKKFSYFNLGDLTLKLFPAIILILGVYLTTITLDRLPYGSLILSLVVALVAGGVAFILFGRKLKIGGTRESSYGPNTLDEANRPKFKVRNASLWLFFVFLVGFFLRFLVFGLPAVPVGYDAPQYLLQALQASELPFFQLLRQGFSISGHFHQDTVEFSGLWLGSLTKILKLLSLSPLLIPKVVMPLISSLCIVAVYTLARLLTNQRAALFSALFLALSPTQLLFGSLYKEIMGGLFLLLVLFFFLSLLKRQSLVVLLFFGLFLFLLFKLSLTAFTKMAVFVVAYGSYLTLGRELSKRKVLGGLFLTGLIGGAVIYYSRFVAHDSLISFKLFKIKEVIPYTYYAFPIVALTGSTGFLVTIFYFFKSLVARMGKEKRPLVSFSFSIFLSIALISFFITTLAGYHFFPSSSQLYALRLCLYLDIPFALIFGFFAFSITKKIKAHKTKVLTVLVLLVFLDFFLTASPHTTVHRSVLNSFIDEEVSQDLYALANYDQIICYGNFTWKPQTSDFAFGNWLKYLIYSRTGRLPIMIESLDELNNVTFEPNKTYLFLNCLNERINDKLLYDHKTKKFIELDSERLSVSGNTSGG